MVRLSSDAWMLTSSAEPIAPPTHTHTLRYGHRVQAKPTTLLVAKCCSHDVMPVQSGVTATVQLKVLDDTCVESVT